MKIFYKDLVSNAALFFVSDHRDADALQNELSKAGLSPGMPTFRVQGPVEILATADGKSSIEQLIETLGAIPAKK